MSSKISYVYSKRRKEFGKQTFFQSVPAHIVDSICADKTEQKNYCLRNPVHREVQATSTQNENEANTDRIVLQNIGINHTEGGWPKEVHSYNEDHLLRYRRRVCHEDNYVHAVKTMAPVMEQCIDQNNAIEMYQTYFKNIPSTPPVESYEIRVLNSFAGLSDRPVSCLVWTNETPPKLAVAYCHRTYDLSFKIFDTDVCYIWDLKKQNKPAYEIHPSTACWQLACSPVDPFLLIGGLQNGVVCLFDIRAKEEAISSSPTYLSHRDPVTSLLYTQSRTHTEFFSGSLDGQCIWWDIRNLSQSLENLPISIRQPNNEEPNLSNSEGISALQFDRVFPTKFLCGTESGYVVNVNRLGRTYSEIVSSYWKAHTGPVRAVHRSPCTYRMFITCGDCSVKIWSEEVHSDPIIIAKPYFHEVTDASWAPLRLSSYMSVCTGGFVYYYDLLRKHHEPVAKLSVSKQELTKISPHEAGRYIAVGDSNGCTFLIQLSENMVWSESTDKLLMQQLYERERKREHILEARVKEIRLKQKIEDEFATAVINKPDEDELVVLAEKEYWKTVRQEQAEFGGKF